MNCKEIMLHIDLPTQVNLALLHSRIFFQHHRYKSTSSETNKPRASLPKGHSLKHPRKSQRTAEGKSGDIPIFTVYISVTK